MRTHRAFPVCRSILKSILSPRNTRSLAENIHGKEDTFVPTYMTEQNYAACKSDKEIMLVDNAAHAASYYEDPAVYENRIKNFLDKHIK